jgi:hypothetical protein
LRINPLELHRAAIEIPDGPETVLMLSQRRVSSLVGFCPLYEFEDLTAQALGAKVAQLGPMSGLELNKTVHKYVRYLTGSEQLAVHTRPRFGAVALDREYELFFPFFNHAHEIFSLNGLPGWRKRCRVAVCYLAEAWAALLPRYQIEMLRDFDHIFVGLRGAVPIVSEITRRPVTFVPMGVDALRFCPYPDLHERVIRVCGIGRRSEVTHHALLEYAENTDSFYYYDTIRTVGTGQVSFAVTDPREHRKLLANLLQRSTYFIANRAFANQPELTRGNDEIPARFYEGTAAGAILVGNPPDTDDFRERFSWRDAVVATPFDAPDIASTLAALDAEPERCAATRRENMSQALLHFDWVYRLRAIFEILGLPQTEGMLSRQRRLRELADQIRSGSSTANAQASASGA